MQIRIVKEGLSFTPYSRSRSADKWRRVALRFPHIDHAILWARLEYGARVIERTARLAILETEALSC